MFDRHLRRFPYWLLFCAFLMLIQPSPTTGMVESLVDPPGLVFPINGEVATVQNFPPLGVPTFSWKPVTGATDYHLQINSDPYFTLPNLLEIHTTNLRYTPTDLESFPDGTYYWRVRVEEPLPGTIFSQPYQFSKAWSSAENAPQLVAPADNEILAFLDSPAFSWIQVTGAASYRFQIASAAESFEIPIYQQDIAALTHQPNYKFANNCYYWRVVPIDPVGNTGMPSAIRSFTLAYGSLDLSQVPDLLTPPQDATLLFTPSFSWTAVPGAQSYQLEYTSGSICSFTSSIIIETNQTSYTPTSNFPDHTMYCWRVRALSGLSIGDWSEIRDFTRHWSLETKLLSPSLANPYARTPVFNWTPVAGAAYYKIEIGSAKISRVADIQAYTTNPFWISPAELLPDQYTWQITPFDSAGSSGAASQSFLFQNPLTATVPALIYPLHYYAPNDLGSSGNIQINPVEARTAAFPAFIWQRVFNPSPYGGLLARTYRIQVSTYPDFSQITWGLDTQNTTATPTEDNDFSPSAGQDYFWRVCPLDLVLPTCQVNPANGDEWWSETRIARFDSSLSPPPEEGDAPRLIRPVHGHEQVEGTPLLEWTPLDSATHYHVQISRDADFATLEHEAYPIYPLYASPLSLAQRNLNRPDYGTFYWRVRGYVDGSYFAWSDSRRFQVASQSEWRRIRVLGNERNRLLVGRDPAGDTSANFDLSTVYISQSNLAWYFGFNASTDNVINMTYVIYIDTDHIDGSGGISPPERAYSVSSIPAHQPEYVLYIDQIAGQMTAQNTRIFTWTGSEWSFAQTLSAAGGALIFTSGEPGYLEIELPDTAIGADRAPDSISAIVFSVNSSGSVLDSVPSDPKVPGSAVLSRFTSASDRMNLIIPPNSADNPPETLPTLIPMYWDWPTGSDPSAVDPAPATPFAGAEFQIALDPQFLILVEDHIYTSNSRYVGTSAASVSNDLVGDATYYWRVRPRYLNAGVFYGAWSEAFSFTRKGFTAQNLRVSTILTTPEFRWDRVEGASLYQLLISARADFDTLAVDITTPNTAFTPLEALTPGTYYWRVGVHRDGFGSPTWSAIEQVSLNLPIPVGLTPNDTSQPFQTIPYLCWQPVIIYSADNIPIASAWKYNLQVSQTADFQTLVDQTDTEMHCWTPKSWYPQGIYYWRVAMIDGSGHPGGYSSPSVFSIQYTTPSLLSPVEGVIFQTPDFIWTAVPGSKVYRLDVSLSADYYPLFETTQTVNIQFTPIFAYTPGQMYYWRVTAFNNDGYHGAYISGQITIGSPSIWLPMIRK
jgi:hypothetical protein